MITKRAKAIRAIESFRRNIDFLSEKGVKQQVIDMQTDHLNNIIEYINAMDDQRQEMQRFIEKLLKVCAVFDIDLSLIKNHPTGVIDAMLCQKKSVDTAFQEKQYLAFSNGETHFSAFHHGAKCYMDPVLNKKFLENNQQIWNKINEQNEEYNSFVDQQIYVRKQFADSILEQIAHLLGDDALKFIELPEEND